MKKIFKFIVPCMALACMMTSCYDTMDDKAVVEAAWGSAETPTVTLTSVNAEATSAEVSFNVSAQKYQEVGVAVSTVADMSNAVYTAAESAEGTNFTVAAKKLTPMSYYYVAAYAVNAYGQRAMSQVQQIATPDIKVTLDMICGNFVSGVVESYFGKQYEMNFIVEKDPDNANGVIFKNLDPFFYSNGFTADNGTNTFKGEVDLDKKLIVIPAEQPVGYQSFVIMGFSTADPDDDDADFDDVYVSIEDYGETLVFQNAWGITGWYNLFYGGLKCSKK